MQEQQLELNLEIAIEQAIAQPAGANLAQLWLVVEHRLRVLAEDEQLRVAGEAIARLAEIYAARAEYLLKAWEDKWDERPPIEPILTDDMLSVFLRQTMSLNLEELLEDYEQHRKRSSSEAIVVEEVEKQVLLDWLEQEEKARAIAVAHDENVSEWIHAIHNWLAANGYDATFTEIVGGLQQKQPKTTLVTVWLGLLLGGFTLHPGSEFYASDFRVSIKQVQ